jgi:hypothetical protein
MTMIMKESSFAIHYGQFCIILVGWIIALLVSKLFFVSRKPTQSTRQTGAQIYQYEP